MKTASYNFVERDGMRCCHRCTVRSFPMKSCGAVEYLLARLVPLLRWDQGVTLEYLALISDLPVTFAFSKSSNTAGDQEYVGPSGVLFCYSVWKRCVMRGVCTTSAASFVFASSRNIQRCFSYWSHPSSSLFMTEASLLQKHKTQICVGTSSS